MHTHFAVVTEILNHNTFFYIFQSEQEIDTITKLHTICNGQRMVRYLNKSESQMIIKHFPRKYPFS